MHTVFPSRLPVRAIPFVALASVLVSVAVGPTSSLAADRALPTRPRYAPAPKEVAASYARAEQLPTLLRDRVFKDRIDPHWLPGSTRFWYRNLLRGIAKEFVLVDAPRGLRTLAFDHKRLAEALSKASGMEYKADKLPFDVIEFLDGGKSVLFKAGPQAWKCDLASYVCTKADAGPTLPPVAEGGARQVPGRGGPPRAQARTEVRSPDGKWIAFVKDSNVWLRPAAGGDEAQLSTDGAPGIAYGALSWSPDSAALIANKIEPGDNREVSFVESSPKAGGRAVLHTRRYDLPGDKFDTFEMWVFDVDSKRSTRVDADRIDFGFPRPRWERDGKRFTFERKDRGHQRFRVFEVDPRTGQTRTIIDERSDTFVNTYNLQNTWYLTQTDEIVWRSEKDGWAHLYLVDVKTSSVTPITSGEWVMRGVERIDEKARQIWFRASGMYPDQDPYFIHFYRVNMDGTELTALTEGNGNHAIRYSPDGAYLIDTFSRVDMPPVHVLRRASDGKRVCELDRADVSALKEEGGRAPEVFVAKGRDGKTDIWGAVYRPMKFDPRKRYPIIENIYAGPHDSFAPKTFAATNRMMALTELGFIVVQCDGMGTSNRSKAFHDVCWQNVGDAGLPDRILWIQALGAKYPYCDASRVGIYGTSAGGQSSTGALLFHPEFYKVAVSSCGCHDNRMDKASWNEAWMGYPVGPWYAESSNIDNAAKLQGKLLLMVGEMDTNVPPESTYRLVDALIKAKKDFDFVALTGMDHTDGGTYGERRRRDFFVRHLHGVEPPDRNATTETTR